ncbi:hypothetical protein [Legionella gresilensis]|uniref:hypothetical protein n=1 Tax=Legionella gresilensis TaxID=91823 RepID=UPI0010413033|nr:hypothetical protein [Legionella gresilensis]
MGKLKKPDNELTYKQLKKREYNDRYYAKKAIDPETGAETKLHLLKQRKYDRKKAEERRGLKEALKESQGKILSTHSEKFAHESLNKQLTNNQVGEAVNIEYLKNRFFLFPYRPDPNEKEYSQNLKSNKLTT